MDKVVLNGTSPSEDVALADDVKAATQAARPQSTGAFQAGRAADPSRLRDDSGLLELDEFATPGAVLAARTRRAVRFGSDVYLPSWGETVVGLPSALLQSNLWSAGDASDERVRDLRLVSLSDDVAIFLTGQKLTHYDRRVFAVCLDHYRLDRPLTPRGIELFIERTFYELAHAMGLAYTRNTHIAVRSSLLRLSAASLRVRTRSFDVNISNLLKVSLDEGYEQLAATELKGSDPLGFRVPEELAMLYGMGAWAPVPKRALEAKGLRGWLSGFYASQHRPQMLPFKTLHAVSGLACRPNDFRARMCSALEELQGREVSEEVRLARHAVSEDGSSITVWKAGW